MNNKDMEPKGFDVKSGWVGRLPDGKTQEFSTEKEYEESLKTQEKEED